MPRQNRVTPLGELIATPARGLVYGNRGCLHDEAGRIRRAHDGRRWIACRLRFRDRRRSPLMAAGRFTELFFLDEATALAAGHRPCGECRHEDYRRLKEILGASHEPVEAIDRRLHAERLSAGAHGPRRRRRHRVAFADLPDGAMILNEGAPWLVLGDELLAWSPVGYTTRTRRPRSGAAEVITPPSLLELLRSGWAGAVALLHPSVNR